MSKLTKGKTYRFTQKCFFEQPYYVENSILNNLYYGDRWLTETAIQRFWSTPKVIIHVLGFLSLRQLIQIRQLNSVICDMADSAVAIIIRRLAQCRTMYNCIRIEPFHSHDMHLHQKDTVVDASSLLPDSYREKYYAEQIEDESDLFNACLDIMSPDEEIEHMKERLIDAFKKIWAIPLNCFRNDIDFEGYPSAAFNNEFLRSRRLLFKCFAKLLKNNNFSIEMPISHRLKLRTETSTDWISLANYSSISFHQSQLIICNPPEILPQEITEFLAYHLAKLPSVFYAYIAEHYSIYIDNQDFSQNSKHHYCQRRRSTFTSTGQTLACLFNWLCCLVDANRPLSEFKMDYLITKPSFKSSSQYYTNQISVRYKEIQAKQSAKINRIVPDLNNKTKLEDINDITSHISKPINRQQSSHSDKNKEYKKDSANSNGKRTIPQNLLLTKKSKSFELEMTKPFNSKQISETFSDENWGKNSMNRKDKKYSTNNSPSRKKKVHKLSEVNNDSVSKTMNGQHFKIKNMMPDTQLITNLSSTRELVAGEQHPVLDNIDILPGILNNPAPITTECVTVQDKSFWQNNSMFNGESSRLLATDKLDRGEPCHPFEPIDPDDKLRTEKPKINKDTSVNNISKNINEDANVGPSELVAKIEFVAGNNDSSRRSRNNRLSLVQTEKGNNLTDQGSSFRTSLEFNGFKSDAVLSTTGDNTESVKALTINPSVLKIDTQAFINRQDDSNSLSMLSLLEKTSQKTTPVEKEVQPIIPESATLTVNQKDISGISMQSYSKSSSIRSVTDALDNTTENSRKNTKTTKAAGVASLPLVPKIDTQAFINRQNDSISLSMLSPLEKTSQKSTPLEKEVQPITPESATLTVNQKDISEISIQSYSKSSSIRSVTDALDNTTENSRKNTKTTKAAGVPSLPLVPKIDTQSLINRQSKNVFLSNHSSSDMSN